MKVAGYRRITTRKLDRNPEEWATFVWTGNNPHCIKTDSWSRADAIKAGKDYLIEKGLK